MKDSRYIYKQPRQDLDLCGYSFQRYSEKSFIQIYRALYGNAMLVPLGGAEGASAKTQTIGDMPELCHAILKE